MAEETPSLATRVGWRLETLAFDVFAGALRLLPVETVSALGGRLMRALGPISREHRIARLNLQLAFPEKSDAERDRILDLQWDNFGRTMFEFAIMDRIYRERRCDHAGREIVDAALAAGRRVVMVGGHFANWEAIPGAAAEAGLNLLVSYRRANNPYMDRRIVESRARGGVHLFAAKGRDGTRELIEALRRGVILGVLNDQRDNAGVEAPFFGRLVRTAPGPVRLALAHDAMLIPVAVRRLPGVRFVAEVHRPIELQRTGDRAADVRAGVAAVNAFMEARIREAPEQWLWAHRRWPVEVYQQLKRRR